MNATTAASAAPGETPQDAGTPSLFIQNATTAEQHASNVRFQLDNVNGFLCMGRGGKNSGLYAARAKAECCLRSAELLLARLEAEVRDLDKTKQCGETESQASLISSAPAGATPAPATNLKEFNAHDAQLNDLGAMVVNLRALGSPGAATASSVVAALPRLTAAQHNAFPKGRWQ